MKRIRTFKKATWALFSLIAAVVVTTFGAMGVTAYRTAAAKSPGVELAAGAVVYDNACSPVQLSEASLATVKTGGISWARRESTSLLASIPSHLTAAKCRSWAAATASMRMALSIL